MTAHCLFFLPPIRRSGFLMRGSFPGAILLVVLLSFSAFPVSHMALFPSIKAHGDRNCHPCPPPTCISLLDPLAHLWRFSIWQRTSFSVDALRTVSLFGIVCLWDAALIFCGLIQHGGPRMEAVALYNFCATESDELSFQKGDVLKVSAFVCMLPQNSNR